MATNQPNITENPDDVMRRFLPNMNKVLNIEDLILYLLSENAIGDNDLPKLTVSGQLSKSQVLVNLQQIVATRGTIEQFMQALERSSEDHAGHKELYDTMVKERQRRMSVSSRRSSTSRLTRNSITSRTQLIPENNSQTDSPSSEEAPPTVIVAESAGAATTQSTSASPSNGQEETTPEVRVNQPQLDTVATDVYQQPERRSFWIGWLFGGLCVTALILAALAITTIVYGALGIQGKDKCGFSDILVGAFDVSSGGLILLLIILMVILMILYTSHKIYLVDSCFLVMLVPVFLLAVISVLGIVANVLFSFISVVKVVYGDYEMWNPASISCSSPTFFSAFTYVTSEFILIALIIIVCGFLLWYYRRRQCCQ